MQKADGMNYAPVSQGKVRVVCQPDEFPFGVIGLDHGHIFAMCNGLMEAGGKLDCVYDPDPQKVKDFIARYPGTRVAESEEAVLHQEDLKLIVSAIRPDRRCDLGIKAMQLGKDYFCDKPGMLKKEEVDAAEACCKETGRKYVIYYGERIHVEGSVYAQELIEEGKIGRVLQVTILAPHRLNPSTRPGWFWEKEKSGGIITDIGSHQIEQFMTYAGAEQVEVLESCVTNYANPEHPEFQDMGQGILRADNGATCYFRVDWFTPAGLNAWGDGRVFIIGTKGTIEIRKYVNVAESTDGDNVYFVDAEGEHKCVATGKTGFVFFGEFILDCLNRTENAIKQDHVFRAMRVTLEAQEKAERNYRCK